MKFKKGQTILATCAFALASLTCWATNEWQSVLDEVKIPVVDFHQATLSNAINQINRMVFEARPNQSVPAVRLELQPEIVITNLTASPQLDGCVEILSERWKARFPHYPHITVQAREIKAIHAIKLVAMEAGARLLQDSQGMPVVCYNSDELLECRKIPFPRFLAEYYKLKPGIEGSDELEKMFDDSGKFGFRGAMMLLPDTNSVLILAPSNLQAKINRIHDAVVITNGHNNSIQPTSLRSEVDR